MRAVLPVFRSGEQRHQVLGIRPREALGFLNAKDDSKARWAGVEWLLQA